MTKTPTAKSPSGDVFIAAIIDGSGSMASYTEGTKAGFDAFVAEQREVKGKARMSVTVFDTGFHADIVGRKLSEIAPLGSPGNPYRASGGTALYDAVGTTIEGTDAWLAAHPKFTGKVKVLVLTDGEENSSRVWSIGRGVERDVALLIAARQDAGWEFIFLGAGGSKWLEAKLGHVVAASQFAGYEHTAVNAAQSLRGASRGLTHSRVTGASYSASCVADATGGNVGGQVDDDLISQP